MYSYGIVLLEVFTRKKPTEEIFVSGLSLKSWVSEAISNNATIDVMDSNLLQGDERHIRKIVTCTSCILELALNCCTNILETRKNMTEIVVSLHKIKAMFMLRQQRHLFEKALVKPLTIV